MGINLSNFLSSKSKNARMIDFQDLDHLDGLSISVVSANLYNDNRDDLSMFYFRDGANYASVYTQSKIVSENIKWNLNQNSKRIYALLVNTRNANAFTGKQGYDSLKKLSEFVASELTKKQEQDEDISKKIISKDIIFGCTGTIGEPFPFEKIFQQISNLINKIKYTQNKFLWMKAALSIMTTDTKPKLAMEECTIVNKKIKIYGIAKGSGMIHPNMATTLGFVFTDATISSAILKNLLRKNIANTFNAITCDGDTSTNDMVSLISTNKANNPRINDFKDSKLKNFRQSLNNVLLNLAKRVASDGEGASKFITINCKNSKTDQDAKNICFSIANSPLVKTAIAGEDPNWGRIAMAVGKSNAKIDEKKLSINIGSFKVLVKGNLYQDYDEKIVSEYMQNELIDITVDIGLGNKNFTAYTMDLTKRYIEINSDYRS